MTKTELNNKLAELYNLPAKKVLIVDLSSTSITGDQKDIYTTSYALLIDDWSRLMDLAVDNGINIEFTHDEEYVKSYSVRPEFNKIYNYSQLVSDYESPQDAVRFSIARALVKLKEIE